MKLKDRVDLSRDVPGAVSVVIGVVMLRISLLSSVYQRYVRVSARPLLIAAGFILIGLGILGIVRSRRAGATDHDTGEQSHGHSHHHVPPTALLLLIPVVAVFTVIPPALGSYASSRAEQKVLAKELKPATSLPPAVNGVVPLTLEDWQERTSVAQNLTVGRYGLIGFVSKDPKATEGEFYLTRITIVCCAADAITNDVPVLGIADPPPQDTWIRVVGNEQVVNGIAEIQADSFQRIKPPEDPYGT